MYPYINVFGLQYSTYGICSAVGVLLMGLVVYLLSRKKNISIEDLLIGTVAALAGAFLGAHILYGITNIPYMVNGIQTFVNEQKDIEYLFGVIINGIGGMVFYGGLLGALGVGALYCKFRKISVGDFADCFAVGIPLFHVFGRIGCFLGGCCYGIESSFGFITKDNTLNPSINGVVRFPVQLLEAALNLGLFFLLAYLLRKNKLKGGLFALYLLIYSVIRFFDEFLRGDSYRGFLFGLSTSQIISILLFVGAVVYFVCYFRRHKNTAKL